MSTGPKFLGATELPWDEGTHRGSDAQGDLDAALRAGRWSLTGLAMDHVFYSADLLQLTGVIAHPVDIFWAENGLPMQETPFRLELNRVIFRGLPEPLDRFVYACPKHHAPAMFRFLDRFAVGDPATHYAEAVHQRLSLVDWKLVDSLTTVPDKPPVVEVHLYGLQDHSKILHWRQPKDLWKESIWLGSSLRKQQTGKKPKGRPGSPLNFKTG